MAPQTDVQVKPRTRQNATRSNGAAARRKPRGTTRSRRASSTEIGQLEKVIRDLESRIAQLTSGESIRSTVSGASNQVGKAVTAASNHVGDMVADTLTDVAGRLRGSANSATGVAKLGVSAMQKVGTELERRPMMTVAIALGIGFLAGLAGRRENA